MVASVTITKERKPLEDLRMRPLEGGLKRGAFLAWNHVEAPSAREITGDHYGEKLAGFRVLAKNQDEV